MASKHHCPCRLYAWSKCCNLCHFGFDFREHLPNLVSHGELVSIRFWFRGLWDSANFCCYFVGFFTSRCESCRIEMILCSWTFAHCSDFELHHFIRIFFAAKRPFSQLLVHFHYSSTSTYTQLKCGTSYSINFNSKAFEAYLQPQTFNLMVLELSAGQRLQCLVHRLLWVFVW